MFQEDPKNKFGFLLQYSSPEHNIIQYATSFKVDSNLLLNTFNDQPTRLQAGRWYNLIKKVSLVSAQRIKFLEGLC